MNRQPLTPEAGSPPPALVAALRRILLSLARLLMGFRIVFPQVAELLKSAYVEVAEREHTLPGKPQTDTRLSLLTGIHRKDIKRLRAQLHEGVEEPLGISQGVRIVARWIGDERYCNADGSPRVLPFKAHQGDDFQTLVEEVCRKDLRPRVVLDEWLRLGIVSEDEPNMLRLNARAFVPSEGIEEKSFFLGMNVADHLDAATANLLGRQPPFFERCVYYDELSAESVAELRRMAAEEGMALLQRLNERAIVLKARDREAGGGEERINVGVYAFDEQAPRSGES